MKINYLKLKWFLIYLLSKIFRNLEKNINQLLENSEKQLPLEISKSIIEYNSVSFVWRKEGKLHRKCGPAIDGDIKAWYFEGKKNIEKMDLRLLNQMELKSGGLIDKILWYLNGIEVKSKEHPFNIFRQKYKLPIDQVLWPSEYKVLFKIYQP